MKKTTFSPLNGRLSRLVCGLVCGLLCGDCLSLNAAANASNPSAKTGDLAASTLNIVLAEPQWILTITNLQSPNTSENIRSNESDFVEKIKPWLAKHQYSDVLNAFEQRPLANDSPALQVLRAQVLLNAKQNGKAEQALNAALATAPNMVNAHRSLSALYLEQQNYALARKHLLKSLELGHGDAQVYGQLAYANLQTHNAFSAIAGYQQALFLEPESQQWQQGLAYALTQAQAFDQAQALVEQLLEQQPNNSEYWLLRSQIALKQQRAEQALSSLEVALRLGHRDVTHQALAAQLHLQHGSLSRAVSLLKQSIAALNAQNASAVLGHVQSAAAWLVYQQQWRELTELLSALDKSKATLPPNQKAQFAVFRAQSALQKGQRGHAKEWLQAAISQNPSMGDALLSLANLFSEDQQPEQAVLYFQRAAAFDNYRERALVGQAQLEINRQGYEPALKLLREAVRHNPARADLADNIRGLEKLARGQQAQ